MLGVRLTDLYGTGFVRYQSELDDKKEAGRKKAEHLMPVWSSWWPPEVFTYSSDNGGKVPQNPKRFKSQESLKSSAREPPPLTSGHERLAPAKV